MRVNRETKRSKKTRETKDGTETTEIIETTITTTEHQQQQVIKEPQIPKDFVIPKITSIIKSLSTQEADNSPDYIDPLFPPIDQSLYSSKKEIVNYETPIIPKFLRDKKKLLLSQFALSQKDGRYSWAKLSDVKDTKKLNILQNPRDINDDVVQGELGDCYFLSTLAALSENPSNISNLVNTSGKGTDNKYESMIIIHGEPVHLIVDSFFPVANASKIAFAGINDKTNNIWPMILEKAWAKCNRSYEDIIPGNSADALEFLTPAPIDTYYHSPESGNNLFNIIQEANKKKFIILADITETKDTNLDTLSKLGLITNHAYMIVSTAVLKKPNGNEIQLLKIKNQWGTNEWIGDWSDGSLKWTSDYKKAVGFKEKEDGIFWMSFDDYLQFYTTTHIAQVNADYYYDVKKFKNKDAKNVSKVVVSQKGSGYFMVNLKNTRIYNNFKNKNYKNPFCVVTIFLKQGDKTVYIGSSCGKKDRFYVECKNLEKGTYYIVVSFPKGNRSSPVQNEFEFDNKPYNFRVGVYSNIKNLKIAEVEDKSEVENFVYDIIENRALNNNEKYTFAQEGEPSSYRCIEFENDGTAFGYIFYQNNSDGYIKEKIELTILDNVNLIPILKDGYFMSQKEEQTEEKKVEPPVEKKETKSRSKHSTYKGKNAPNENTNVEEKVNEKIDYESKTVSQIINGLKGTKLESSYNVLAGKKKIIQMNVAPHSSCAILLQKTGEEADVDLNSDICFDYLPNVLLGEQKFNQKKYRLKYNNKSVEVYEFIAEHNTGVFFQYKNRSSEFRLKVTATFSKFENLYLLITSSDLVEKGEVKLKKYVENKFRDDNDENSVTLIVEPGETGFFGLNAIDAFDKFSYACQFDYHFSLYKVTSGLLSSFEEGGASLVNKEEVKDI